VATAIVIESKSTRHENGLPLLPQLKKCECHGAVVAECGFENHRAKMRFMVFKDLDRRGLVAGKYGPPSRGGVVDCVSISGNPEAGRQAYCGRTSPGPAMPTSIETCGARRISHRPQSVAPAGSFRRSALGAMGIGATTPRCCLRRGHGSIAARLCGCFAGGAMTRRPSSTTVFQGGFGLLAAERCSGRGDDPAGHESRREPFHAADTRGLRREHGGGTRARIAGPEGLLVDARAQSDTRGGLVEPSIRCGRTYRSRESLIYRNSARTAVFCPPPSSSAAAGSLPADDLKSGRLCGSGFNACHICKPQVAASPGGPAVRGSWSEWIRDRGGSVARGDGRYLLAARVRHLLAAPIAMVARARP